MPIYEYRCTSCGAELEKLQKISDPPLVECPECGKDALVKLVSASSFRLKGSGWYETDFKTGNKKNGVGEASSGAEGSSAAEATATPESAKDKEAKPGKDSAGASKNGKDSTSDSKDTKGKEPKKEAAKSGGGADSGAGKSTGATSKPTPKT